MNLGAIILINYNTASLTLKSVASIIEYTPNFSDFQLIVIDNASNPEDYSELKQGLESLQLQNLKLVRSRINTGFGGGNMIGVQNADAAEFYIFINSDVFLTEDSFNIMIQFLKTTPDASIAGANSVDENGKMYKPFDYHLGLRKEIFSDNFNRFLNPKRFPNRKIQLKEPTVVGMIPGSLIVCNAADFDAVGGFDTNLFLYYEEKDLSFRLRKKGKETYSLPQTTFLHLKGKSTPRTYAIQQELKASQFYTIRKNLGAIKYMIFYCSSLFKFAYKAPFSSKNRKLFFWILRGASLTESLKHKQKIVPPN